MWAYLTFIGYIKTKEQTELTGVEQYIFDMIKHDNLNWFPVKRFLLLSFTLIYSQKRTLNFIEEDDDDTEEDKENKLKAANLIEITNEVIIIFFKKYLLLKMKNIET